MSVSSDIVKDELAHCRGGDQGLVLGNYVLGSRKRNPRVVEGDSWRTSQYIMEAKAAKRILHPSIYFKMTSESPHEGRVEEMRWCEVTERGKETKRDRDSFHAKAIPWLLWDLTPPHDRRQHDLNVRNSRGICIVISLGEFRGFQGTHALSHFPLSLFGLQLNPISSLSEPYCSRCINAFISPHFSFHSCLAFASLVPWNPSRWDH